MMENGYCLAFLKGSVSSELSQNVHEYIIEVQKNEKLTKIAISVMTNAK